MVHLHRQGQQASREIDWEVPVLGTVGATGAGVDELLQQITAHRTALEQSGVLERRRQVRRARELRDLILAELRREVDEALGDGGPLGPVLADVEAGRLDPYTAIARIRERLTLFRDPGA
jgi:LAO/AO transport system kinase